MLRVASLLPSTTEIVCALGLEQALVGRSHECDHPLSVAHLPILTNPRLDPEGSSGAIDREVKSLLRQAISIYEVRTAELTALRPEVILTQSQCEVCAVTEDDVERALADWSGVRPRIVSLAPNSLQSVWGSITQVAEALGQAERGEEVLRNIRERVEAVQSRAEAAARPRVACIEWVDPLMAAGNWVPELVALAGGDNLFGEAGVDSPWIDGAALAQAAPDVIVVMPCGFGLERTRAEMAVLDDNPHWTGLAAVGEGRVFLTDGNHYFNRPGPRLADSQAILAEILHPTLFPPQHQGTAWERL